MPFFLGVSDDDPHIRVSRAEDTVAAFEGFDADVRFDESHGRGHGIFPEAVEYLRELVGTLVG